MHYSNNQSRPLITTYLTNDKDIQKEHRQKYELHCPYINIVCIKEKQFLF